MQPSTPTMCVTGNIIGAPQSEMTSSTTMLRVSDARKCIGFGQAKGVYLYRGLLMPSATFLELQIWIYISKSKVVYEGTELSETF
jgi:hypothetical protein